MDELSKRRPLHGSNRPQPFHELLARGIRWPFQTALEFPAALPEMPKMVSSRRPRGQIHFESKKMCRVVHCESNVERRFFEKLDALPDVLWFHEQASRLPYLLHGRSRNHVPDAVVALTNGHVFVVEVKMKHHLGFFSTICKANALTELAHRNGHGVFLGDSSASVGDVLKQDIPRLARAAILTAVKKDRSISSEEWSHLREHLRITRAEVQPLLFRERLVMTQDPFAIRRANAEEGREIDAFVERFESVAPVLPLSARAAKRPAADASERARPAPAADVSRNRYVYES